MRLSISLALLLTVITASSVSYADEVPFEVVKTQMEESIIVNEIDRYYYDGSSLELHSAGTFPRGYSEDWYANNPIIVVSGYKYTVKFWNIGAMGYLGAYADAQLIVEPIIDRAYVCTDVFDFYPDGEPYCLTEQSVNYADIPAETVDLHFFGGPYGNFGLANDSGGYLIYGSIYDGSSISIMAPKKESGLFKYHWGLRQDIPIQGDGFKKWMEILNGNDQCSDPSNPSTDSGIRFSDIWGRVQVVSCNDYIDEAWRSAILGMTLFVEDHIKTGRNESGAILSLTDLTTFKMRPNTEVVLSNPPESESKIKLIAGKIWVNFQKMIQDGSMEVEMSQAAAGIKGTTFVAEETEAGSRLKVIEGEVELTSKTSGQTVTVNTGEAVQITSSGIDDKVSFDVKQETQNWNNMSDEYVETTSFCPSLDSSTLNISIPYVEVGGMGHQAKLLYQPNLTDNLYWKLDTTSLQEVTSSCSTSSQCLSTTTKFDEGNFKLSIPCITVNGLTYQTDLLFDDSKSSSGLYWQFDSNSFRLVDGYVIY